MNPPDQPTQPTEAQRKLAAEIIFEAESLYPKAMIPIAAQLIADSEARAVQAAIDAIIAKNAPEITAINAELAAAKAERDLAITRVACILWSGAIDKHTCGDVQKWADYYTAELTRLRDEVERLKGALALGQQNCDDAYDDLREQRDEAIARAEKAEADTARLDWLAVSDTWFDYPATESFNPETFRDAIDAAMKGTI
jgi:Skp family chaperone for outer membrane proteins